MTWLLVLNLTGLILAIGLVLESFRPTPMWLRPAKAPSPRQRRWFGLALILILSGNTINWLNMAHDTELGLLAFVFIGLGMVALIVGVVKGPTDEELERRIQLLMDRNDD